MREYYKKLDKSFFKYGITIPKEYVKEFIFDADIPLGDSREIKIIFRKKQYPARISHVNRLKAKDVYQIRWDSNKELLSLLKQEFIQTYFAIESQEFTSKQNNEYHVTHLLGGNQEVVIFKPLNDFEILLEVYIKIETPYDNISKKLVEENVFGWLSAKSFEKSFITKSTHWMNSSELFKHENANYVVYYLIDETNKQIYIGSAIRLEDRVKIGRKEIPFWNKFRYEIVHPEYHCFLREIEYHSIMNFAKFFSNNGNLSSLELGEYTLVNKDYKFYIK